MKKEMNTIKLGERIKGLRLRNKRTQEELAAALGITAQAVSRWEKALCYPDMELIPSIAKYFGISIDELFGYDNEMPRKIDALVKKINEMNRQNNGEDVCLDQCIALARESLIEFPENEKLMLALASVLYNAGYVRYGEHHLVGEDGYSLYDIELHKTYAEWQEAVKIYEKLLVTMTDEQMRQKAMTELAQLYANLGKHEKAMQLAGSAPELYASKTFLRIRAFDGKEAVAATEEALVEVLRISAELIESIVLTDCSLPPKTASEMLECAISILRLVCMDGNFGRLYGFVSCLSMLRSYYLWLADEHDAAFKALDYALECALSSDRLTDGYYTSPLLSHVKIEAGESERNFTAELPDVWPWWSVPEYDLVKSEMQADARWDTWVKEAKTRS